ncbi:hypothetical protein NQZ68_016787 [Dissostichus eleginoides]|nr:hypothetical protein NQZ68_016787 [Dissostichus eleginoides]
MIITETWLHRLRPLIPDGAIEIAGRTAYRWDRNIDSGHRLDQPTYGRKMMKGYLAAQGIDAAETRVGKVLDQQTEREFRTYLLRGDARERQPQTYCRMLFDGESDIEDNVSETEDNVEEYPD